MNNQQADIPVTFSPKTIKDSWQYYSENAISPHASDRQVREMKKVFYSGAEALFSVFVNQIASSTDQETAVTNFKKINEELISYAKSIERDEI